mmetsp:Transcript_29196/g.73293  ORF Transcript_29196/g.73293 Transcript_29196/m.73293 type:complete len:253 (+) Transcript_29196:2094-2852(+)
MSACVCVPAFRCSGGDGCGAHPTDQVEAGPVRQCGVEQEPRVLPRPTRRLKDGQSPSGFARAGGGRHSLRTRTAAQRRHRVRGGVAVAHLLTDHPRDGSLRRGVDRVGVGRIQRSGRASVAACAALNPSEDSEENFSRRGRYFSPLLAFGLGATSALRFEEGLGAAKCAEHTGARHPQNPQGSFRPARRPGQSPGAHRQCAQLRVRHGAAAFGRCLPEPAGGRADRGAGARRGDAGHVRSRRHAPLPRARAA